MNNFKIGDRVVVTETEYSGSHLQPGMTGQIVSQYGRDDDCCFGVRMDTGRRDDLHGDGWGFFPHQLRPELQS